MMMNSTEDKATKFEGTFNLDTKEVIMCSSHVNHFKRHVVEGVLFLLHHIFTFIP